MEPSLQSEAAAGARRIAAFPNPFAGWLIEKNLGRGFWVFFATAFFFDFGFSVYFFLFNLYLLDLRFNERAMGLIGGSFTLGSLVGTLPAGMLARKTGLRPMLAACLLAAPAFGALRAIATWLPAQLALAFVAGLAMCIWGVSFQPALARLTTPQNRASAFSLIFSASIGTSALGGAICGYLPHWLLLASVVMPSAAIKRTILLAACVISALGLFPLLWLRIPAPSDEPGDRQQNDGQQTAAGEEEVRASGRNPRRLWGLHPFLLRFLPAMALWSAVLVSFTPFANVYLSTNLHIPIAGIGLIFSAAQVLQFCLVLLTPALFRSMGLRNGIVATQVATAAFMLCLAGAGNPTLAVALYLSLSATQWMSSPGLYNMLMSEVPDRERSKAAAMTMFSNALLQSGATAIAGILFARFGYPRVLIGIAAVAVLAALQFRFLAIIFQISQAESRLSLPG